MTIGVYIQAAVKLFGTWSIELSQDWDSGKIQDIREVVDTVISRLKNFTSHPEIEVQERVRLIDAFFKSYHGIWVFQAANAVQLFNFIRADLASRRLEEDSTTSLPVDETNQNPAYPKSLLLIDPLFSIYELNSVNIAAQDSIPVPEFLDLDAWIVPPPREFTLPDAAVPDDAQSGEQRPIKKKLKSKGKGKGKEKGSEVGTQGPPTDPIPSLGRSETEEDRVEREKAS